ncbi:AAA family ATPase [Quadrisphaera sp. DSM 44207]|uniref:AAA family ATPase n=1 Tax=Quadrisphaera sp. DSM 44207 TaxID=1881057 RepID=UPI000886A480|nr:AAA family ATPase [Quadrisphaera sp. DSM 44207]SDQ74433.1 Predicted ATPase [Quadrisphaera sp. DSM 44207]
MITRLEIDGFKSFADFSVDLPPFVAIVGPNASGKSNIFDAMAFLERVVSSPVAEALARGRGEPVEQFRLRGDGSRVRAMRFSVDLLVEKRVDDDFGTSAEVTHTRLRYRIDIEQRLDERGVERPFIAEESIRPIPKGEDVAMQGVTRSFADEHLLYRASQWKILETETREDGRRVFSLKGARPGGGPGRNREIPAQQAVSSVLTSVTTAIEFPFLYAVRREILSWRFLQLEPSALRQPSVAGAPVDHLDTSGRNLAWVLETVRQAQEAAGGAGLDTLAADLARVITGFRSIAVRPNEARGQWELELHSREEGAFSARVASDGTLRLLALLTALYEPDRPGVLCLEEPENGINPRRLTAMLAVLRQLVTDPHEAEGGSGGLVQLIVSSHSPLLPLRMEPDELLVVDTVSLVEDGVGASRITRARRIVRNREQMELGDGADWSPLPPHQRERLSGITPEDGERIVDAG